MTDAEKIIDALGGTSEVARICNIRAPSVSEWRRNGIPQARLQFLELLRPDVFNEVRKGVEPARRSPVAEDQGVATTAASTFPMNDCTREPRARVG